MALLFEERHNPMQVDILAHASDERLITNAEEPMEVLFLITSIDIRVRVLICNQIEDLLLDREDPFQSMLPQVFLLLLSNSATLLVTDLDHLIKDVIELLDVLI